MSIIWDNTTATGLARTSDLVSSFLSNSRSRIGFVASMRGIVLDGRKLTPNQQAAVERIIEQRQAEAYAEFKARQDEFSEMQAREAARAEAEARAEREFLALDRAGVVAYREAAQRDYDQALRNHPQTMDYFHEAAKYSRLMANARARIVKADARLAELDAEGGQEAAQDAPTPRLPGPTLAQAEAAYTAVQARAGAVYAIDAPEARRGSIGRSTRVEARPTTFMSPLLSGGYTEVTEDRAYAHRCNGCGRVWEKRWHADTCQDRAHADSFEQGPYGVTHQENGKLMGNPHWYTRRAIRKDRLEPAA